MIVNFSMYGLNLNCIDVLYELQNLPSHYQLWENGEELKDENGFTLSFQEEVLKTSLPFSIGKFLLANRTVLTNEVIIGKETVKEISVVIEKRVLDFLSKPFHLTMCSLKPSFSKLLAELNIELNISTEL